MGTPAADERILWKGQPDLSVLARTAFHTRSIGIYFVILIGVALLFGNPNAAVMCTVLGVLALLVLQALAWFSRRTTLYILTDTRLIMRVGMALETRINMPLKHIGAAHLKERGKGFGDIALELNGERLLGYWLLWPHARPFRFSRPQPMLRAVPDAQKVAQLLAEACSAHKEIDQNLIEVKEDAAPAAKPLKGPAATSHPDRRPEPATAGNGLKGAPA